MLGGIINAVYDFASKGVQDILGAGITITVQDVLEAVLPENSVLLTDQDHPGATEFSFFYIVIMLLGLLIGLIAIISAGYTLMTSQGAPDKVKAGSEKLTSAILGSIFIALSLGILRFIMNTLF